MARKYVISIMAANRIGLLAAVTRAMSDLGGNLFEASQTVVHNFFALVFAAEFPDDRDPQLIHDHITDVGRSYGLLVSVKDPDQEEFSQIRNRDPELHRLVISGPDQPGVMRDVSARLAQRTVDINGLHAIRDEDSYRIEMDLAVPNGTDVEALVEEIESVAANVHWQ